MEGSSLRPAQLLWETVAAAGQEPGLVTGLQTVLLPELVWMQGAAEKRMISAEVPGSLGLVQRAAAGCKECGIASQLAPGFLQVNELQAEERFPGQKPHLEKCILSS